MGRNREVARNRGRGGSLTTGSTGPEPRAGTVPRTTRIGPAGPEPRAAPAGAAPAGPESARGRRARWARAPLTFDAEIRATAASIERLCRKSPEKMRLFFDGHVSGIKNLVYGKAADMALLYAAIRSADRDSRLRALARLRDEAQNYLGLEMPYNTRRALIALVKETVKAQGDPLQSYRCVSAFRQTLSGRATTVRWMLDELGLAEVPETGAEATGALAPRASGWDDHVYDNAGPGRKTPAQLVLDAYIKGLSRLTIVYEDLMELEPLEEALEAGKIMGIRVTIGLECLVQTEAKKRFYHVLLLDACSDAGEARDILASPPFKRLLKLVQQNYDEYEGIYERLVEEFNEKSLPVINGGFEGTAGALPPLSVKALKAWAKDRHLFHVHLGQYLARALGEVAEARRAISAARSPAGASGAAAAGAAADGAHEEPAELGSAASALASLAPGELRKAFLDPIYRGLVEDGDFVKSEKLYALVAELNADRSRIDGRGVAVAFTRPLSEGLEACVKHLVAHSRSIDALEVWNNRSRRPGYAEDARFLEDLRVALNAGDAGRASALVAAKGIAGVPPEDLAAAAMRYRSRPLRARIASGSDGYNHFAPGMGFAPMAGVRNRRAVMRRNFSSPLPVRLPLGDRRRGRGDGVLLPLGRDRGAEARLREVRGGRGARRGREDGAAGNGAAGNGDSLAPSGNPARAVALLWRDLNPKIRHGARMAAGAGLSLLVGAAISLASGFPPSFGAFELAAWFAITFARNYVVDQSARHGLHPSRWRYRSFDESNAATSVFFTFFSIPLLRFTEQLLDRLVLPGLAEAFSLEQGGVWMRLARFVPLALVNGCYIYSHNSLRGFTRPVKGANFLRSVLAFPLSVLLSYLNPFGPRIPGALINKVASDIVGGFTEAAFKIRRETRRARAMYATLLPKVASEPSSKKGRYEQRMAVLDTLYVWGETPRGKDTLRAAIVRDPSSERIWERLQEPVRDYEKYARLIVDRTRWRKSARIKLEFLRLSASFSYWLERKGGRERI